tara:strand:- start:66923 stop:67159 length:237 start_codon:yes stop_codon:yes gene_type:complete
MMLSFNLFSHRLKKAKPLYPIAGQVKSKKLKRKDNYKGNLFLLSATFAITGILVEFSTFIAQGKGLLRLHWVYSLRLS